jgi:hypothetical protein
MKDAAKDKITPFDPSEGRADKKVPLIQVARMMQRRTDPVTSDTTFDYKKHLKFAWVPADLIYFNYYRQRYAMPTQCNKLNKKWNINCVTPLQCRYSPKENRYYGADGQQHTIAWVLNYGEHSDVPVWYVESEDESIESHMVLALNNDNEPMAEYFIHTQEVILGIPEAVALENCVLDAGCTTAYKKKKPGCITHISDLRNARDHYGLDNLNIVLKKMRQYWPGEKIFTATMLGLLKLKSILDANKIYDDNLMDDIFYHATQFFESSDRLHLDIKDEFERAYPTNYKGMGVREKVASGIISAYEQLSGKTLCTMPFAITMPIIKQTV